MEERRQAAEGLTERAEKYLKKIPGILKSGMQKAMFNDMPVEAALAMVPRMEPKHVEKYLRDPGHTPVRVKLALAGYFIAEAAADLDIIKKEREAEEDEKNT